MEKVSSKMSVKAHKGAGAGVVGGAAARGPAKVVEDGAPGSTSSLPPAPVKFVKAAVDCPVETVTVFSDRAEVTRVFAADLPLEGQYDIVMEGLNDYVNVDSLRVKGKGDCTILEVSHAVNYKTVEPAAGSTADVIERLRTRVTELTDEIGALAEESARIVKLQRMLDTYIGRALKPSVKEAAVPSLDFASQALDLLLERTSHSNAEQRRIEDRTKVLQAELDTNNSKLASLGSGKPASKRSRDAVVTVQANAPGPVIMSFVYQISHASWKPSYDVRISSQESQLSLTYYGNITQSTGEDWRDTRLVLSTASPAVGGVPPALTPKFASLESTYSRSHGVTSAWMDGANDQMLSTSFNSSMLSQNRMMFRAPPSSSAITSGSRLGGAGGSSVATARVTGDSVASASFSIDRSTTVESDNKPHKVTIAILEMVASMRHFCAPALSQQAYLQAWTTNTSQYMLLASDKVNVFVDNSFVSVTELENVSPGESFRSFLGVDAGVRVEYRDLGVKADTTGMWYKYHLEHRHFSTTIKNTLAVPVVLLLADILPKSTDSRIKVRVVDPEPAVLEAGTKSADVTGGVGEGDVVHRGDTVAQNTATNNVVWLKTIPSQGKIVVNFEYVFEYPTTLSIAVV